MNITTYRPFTKSLFKTAITCPDGIQQTDVLRQWEDGRRAPNGIASVLRIRHHGNGIYLGIF